MYLEPSFKIDVVKKSLFDDYFDPETISDADIISLAKRRRLCDPSKRRNHRKTTYYNICTTPPIIINIFNSNK